MKHGGKLAVVGGKFLQQQGGKLVQQGGKLLEKGGNLLEKGENVLKTAVDELKLSAAATHSEGALAGVSIGLLTGISARKKSTGRSDFKQNSPTSSSGKDKGNVPSKGTGGTTEQLQEFANKANQVVSGQGTVPGTLKHWYVNTKLNNFFKVHKLYKKMINISGLYEFGGLNLSLYLEPLRA